MFLVGVPFENPVEFVPLTVKEIKPRKPLKGNICNSKYNEVWRTIGLFQCNIVC